MGLGAPVRKKKEVTEMRKLDLSSGHTRLKLKKKIGIIIRR
jgi:hypothetical protein